MLFKKVSNLSAFAALAMLLYGCTTPPANNSEIEEEIKKEILGKNIDLLYSEWGPASTTTQLPSHKGKIYIWRYRGCKSIVTTDNEGVVTNYSATGNCVLVK